ncbi:MAG: hypothetical protein HZA35_01690 [Parcubacteria group bacterium]|nr:hypothetical protein [Parcubacteria group bacterium]
MFGLVLAVLYAAYLYAITKAPQEVAYLNSSNFLFWWYVVWAVVTGAFLVVMILGFLFVGGVGGAMSGGPLGAFLGLGAGGAISGLLVLGGVINNVLFVGGAYLLHSALVHQATGYTWDMGRLVIGGLLLLIGILSTRSSSGSSLNNSD